MKILTVLTLLIGLTLNVAKAQSLDDLVNSCNDCHGDNGVSQWEDVPTVAGISAFVHADALYLYRDAERPCMDSEYRQGDTARPAANMCQLAKALTDDQIEALAEHYAELPFVPAKQPFDPAKAAAGKVIHDGDCERCHVDGGADPDEDASILAGQWMGYLATAFAEYASGEREQPEKMKQKLDPLSEADIQTLLHYYASQQ
jgi:sulfide dehydrogenase cytochrome subunit